MSFISGSGGGYAVAPPAETPPPAQQTPRVIWDSAAPTTGTWAVGDTVYNTALTTGGFMGWVCTIAGTPGTWKQFGVIST